METEFIGSLYGHGPGYAGAVFDSEYVSPTLTTMQGGGREPHIVEVKKVAEQLCGFEEKVIAIDEQNNCTREDTFGCLTTDGSSPKHNNRVCEINGIKIRQATKDGFVNCQIGVGGRLELSDKSNEKRKSARERTDKSYSDNGEYP